MTSFHYARQSSSPRYVSATRLYSILRTKLGCSDGGWRDQESWYWVTANGIPFPVADPAAHPNCRPVHGGARQELCFPYEYARDLLQSVRNLMSTNKAHTTGASLPRLAIG